MSMERKQILCLLAPIIGSLSRSEFAALIKAIRTGAFADVSLGTGDLLRMYDQTERDNAMRMSLVLMARKTGIDEATTNATSNIMNAISFYMDYNLTPVPAIAVQGSKAYEAVNSSYADSGVVDIVLDTFNKFFEDYEEYSIKDTESTSLVADWQTGASPGWEFIVQMYQGLQYNLDY